MPHFTLFFANLCKGCLASYCFSILLKFGYAEKATKFEPISHLIWHVLSKRQIMWEIFSNFLAFLENLNINKKKEGTVNDVVFLGMSRMCALFRWYLRCTMYAWYTLTNFWLNCFIIMASKSGFFWKTWNCGYLHRKNPFFWWPYF